MKNRNFRRLYDIQSIACSVTLEEKENIIQQNLRVIG